MYFVKKLSREGVFMRNGKINEVNYLYGKFSAGTALIAAFLVVLLFASGCGTGSAGNQNSSEGAYSLSVNWPDNNARSGERIIPQGSSSISISITGDELTNPVTTSINTSRRA